MKKFCVFDGHCDTAPELWMRKENIDCNTCMVSLKRAEKLEGYAQFFAFCMAWMSTEEPAEELFRRSLDYFRKQVRMHEDRIAFCCSAPEGRKAMQEGKCAAYLSIEGAEAIGCDPGRLEDAWEMGVRMISLVWNVENELSGSCLTGGGLTKKGKEFARRAQKLGMILDVSHLSERGFWDLMDIAEKPVIASHSNSAAIQPNPRNLTDEQFRALCETGGTAGINLYGNFLTSGSVSFEDVRRHMDHFIEIGGEDHVALGADLDGCDNLPAGFTGVDNYNELAQYLSGCGYRDELLQKIYCDSLMGVLTACGNE